jgi:hypothetical protein
MSDTNKEIKKFLDYDGLQQLWTVIAGKFADVNGVINGVIHNIANDDDIKSIFNN